MNLVMTEKVIIFSSCISKILGHGSLNRPILVPNNKDKTKTIVKRNLKQLLFLGRK